MIYLFFYLPIAVLIVYSFNNSSYSLVWHGFTTGWYHALFSDSGLWIAALHSLIIGTLAATFATIIGTLAAVSLYRYRFMGKGLLNGMVFILIVTPDIVMGISLLLLFSIFDMPLGFWSLLLSHITFCIPFVVVTVYSRISGMDKNIFEAAKDLGARELSIFTKITIPLLLPAIISGILLSFTLSFDDVMISYFVSGPSFEILPLKIYSMARLGVKPELNALCSVTFILTLLLVVLSQKLTRKES
ncbi:MAG: spermidine/putrescine ABC transporter permease PotC [Gammaproteobacteria bacterium]